jgi:Family of unknown function (DUF6029)
MKHLFFSIFLLLFCTSIFAQNAENQQDNSGVLTGAFEAQGNFFHRDTAIGAFNTPQYDYQKFGAQSWLNLNYSNHGFDMGIRFDLFNNSNLLNPTGSYTAQGIGNWFIKKKVQKFDFAAGYLYDQIGSGIIFRSFEARPLAIDNALYGVSAAYHLSKDWKAKVFTGKQKQQFDSYGAIIKGFSTDAFYSLGDSTKPWSIAPGFGVVGRTFDKASVDQIVGAISTYNPVDSIGAQYNTYAFSAYNTLSAGPFSWYIEGAYKTKDVFFDPFASRTLAGNETTLGKLQNKPGSIIYTSLSYANDIGLGITLEGKRTENFIFRTNPFVTLNRGILNFLPPMTKQNTYRLTARYSPATQELGEQAIQGEIRYKINKKWGIFVNFSDVKTLDKKQLYQEIFTELTYKQKKYNIIGGVQLQRYNQDVYETKPGVPMVATLTPYVEVLYKFSRKKALRCELQYMNSKQDYGSWIFALAEYSMAPHWVMTVSDMYNAQPKKTADLHYPTVAVAYTQGSNRVSLSYVKQVQGVVCSGGICRLEPAFSGARLTLNSSF